MGSISSDVERKTAMSVPLVTRPLTYRLAVAAEKPHCGITPRTDPRTGPSRPARWTISTVFSSAFASINP